MHSDFPQRRLLAAAVVAALVSSIHVAPVRAQEAPPAEQARRDEPATLSTLVVTAQKREEALQDVPIVINVLPEQLRV